MRVVHVVASAHDPAAGTTVAVTRLCEELAARGLDVELHTLAPPPVGMGSNVRVVSYARWPVPARLGISPPMRACLEDAARRADLVHGHGLWTMPNLYAGAAARAAGRPHVCSVHGMLMPWASSRSRWKKRLVGLAGQWATLRTAACLHATAEAERARLRGIGLRQPISVVPHGVDVPATFAPPRGVRRTLLFLGRLHPSKGVDVLLRAWREVERELPSWDLVICGPDDGLGAALRRGGTSARRVTVLGPRYGADKEALLEACELLVLPTHGENFGFVVAEALAHARPAIVTRAAPWEGLERHRCGFWIECGKDALVRCLRDVLGRPRATLAEMGLRGRSWVAEAFRWEDAGARMAETYAWLLGRAPRPPWVT
ncbi:MAG: glycosyltransferase [Sandaracinaceae bacterium]